MIPSHPSYLQSLGKMKSEIHFSETSLQAPEHPESLRRDLATITLYLARKKTCIVLFQILIFFCCHQCLPDGPRHLEAFVRLPRRWKCQPVPFVGLCIVEMKTPGWHDKLRKHGTLEMVCRKQFSLHVSLPGDCRYHTVLYSWVFKTCVLRNSNG